MNLPPDVALGAVANLTHLRVCCHPDNGDRAFVDRVPVLEAEAAAAMEVAATPSMCAPGLPDVGSLMVSDFR